jgi:hypothetical protein
MPVASRPRERLAAEARAERADAPGIHAGVSREPAQRNRDVAVRSVEQRVRDAGNEPAEVRALALAAQIQSQRRDAAPGQFLLERDVGPAVARGAMKQQHGGCPARAGGTREVTDQQPAVRVQGHPGRR